jgi:hypothetical protein
MEGMVGFIHAACWVWYVPSLLKLADYGCPSVVKSCQERPQKPLTKGKEKKF